MRTLLIAALALTAAPALAREPQVAASAAWSRPAAAGATGAGYLVLTNTGEAAAVLVGASSPRAERVEVHSSEMHGGMMHMAMTPNLTIPPGGRLVLQPGGQHLMFVKLKTPLKRGERLPATLRFESGATLAVQFEVRTAAP